MRPLVNEEFLMNTASCINVNSDKIKAIFSAETSKIGKVKIAFGVFFLLIFFTEVSSFGQGVRVDPNGEFSEHSNNNGSSGPL